MELKGLSPYHVDLEICEGEQEKRLDVKTRIFLFLLQKFFPLVSAIRMVINKFIPVY